MRPPHNAVSSTKGAQRTRGEPRQARLSGQMMWPLSWPISYRLTGSNLALHFGLALDNFCYFSTFYLLKLLSFRVFICSKDTLKGYTKGCGESPCTPSGCILGCISGYILGGISRVVAMFLGALFACEDPIAVRIQLGKFLRRFLLHGLTG